MFVQSQKNLNAANVYFIIFSMITFTKTYINILCFLGVNPGGLDQILDWGVVGLQGGCEIL